MKIGEYTNIIVKIFRTFAQNTSTNAKSFTYSESLQLRWTYI